MTSRARQSREFYKINSVTHDRKRNYDTCLASDQREPVGREIIWLRDKEVEHLNRIYLDSAVINPSIPIAFLDVNQVLIKFHYSKFYKLEKISK